MIGSRRNSIIGNTQIFSHMTSIHSSDIKGSSRNLNICENIKTTVYKLLCFKFMGITCQGCFIHKAILKNVETIDYKKNWWPTERRSTPYWLGVIVHLSCLNLYKLIELHGKFVCFNLKPHSLLPKTCKST